MQIPGVRPEDVMVIDFVDLLVELLGEPAYDTGVFSYEQESWAVVLWCLFNCAVYYAAPADEVDLDAARALAVRKGRSKVVVEYLGKVDRARSMDQELSTDPV